MFDKKQQPTKLLWVDLEMTGLNPKEDVILEVAAIITDFDFKELDTYEACISQPRELVVARMDESPFWRVQVEGRDAFINKLSDGEPPAAAEQALITLVQKHFDGEPAILAGNSIYNDRNFIKVWWPRLDALLHYRMLDVSSYKILMQGKHGLDFKKTDKHRALSDIQESISELQYYLEWLKTNQQNT